MSIKKIIEKFPDFLWLWTILATIAGLLSPATFLSLKPAIKPLLGSVILAMGLTLKGSDFVPIFKQPKKVFVGWLSQYTVMPFTGFLVGYLLLLHFNKEWVAGQVLTGACPTGVVSNVYTYLSMGNVALSITLSATNTVIAPVITPILTKVLAGRYVPVNMWKLFLDMVQVTLIPVLLGITINTVAKKYVDKIRPILPVYASLAVATIVAYVAAAGHAKILTLSIFAILALIIASIIHLFIGYGLGYLIANVSGLEIRDRVTISVETAMQNSGLATVLAVTHWSPMAALPAITYSVIQNILGPFVCTFYRKLVRQKK
ncbi:bile acid:sodium symporter family protein [Thermococcus sp.]